MEFSNPFPALFECVCEKIFFANMFFYHFLQLCPQGHISKMLAVTVIENTILSAFGIFKSVSCLIRMRLRENFFCKHVLLSFTSTLSPRSYLENACCNRYWKHGFKRLWNFQIRFLPYSRYDLGDKVEENDKRTCLQKKFFRKRIRIRQETDLKIPRALKTVFSITVTASIFEIWPWGQSWRKW